MTCTHTHTTQSEEGYECLLCGQVLGHSWNTLKRKRGGVHYPGDYAHVERCRECRERIGPTKESTK